MILIHLEGIIQTSVFEALHRKIMLETKIQDKIYDIEFQIKSFKLIHYLERGAIIKFDCNIDENSKEIKELSNIWIKIK